MEKEKNTENQSLEALYDKALNYVINKASSPFASKVIEAQRLLKKARYRAHYDRAFQLLQEVCGGKKEPISKPVWTRRYPLPFGGILQNGIPGLDSNYIISPDLDSYSVAAEPLYDDLPIRESSQSSYQPREHVERTKKHVDEAIKKIEEEYDERYDVVYALAFTLMGAMLKLGEYSVNDPNEAIRKLRIAQKIGGKKGEQLELLAREMMHEIISVEDAKTLVDTVKSSVEIVDLDSKSVHRRGERYAIVLHHADGRASEIHLTGRFKLMYTLALMMVCGCRGTKLVPRLFLAHKESLIRLVEQMRIPTGRKSVEYWLSEFVYKEEEANQDLREEVNGVLTGVFSYNSNNYSQTRKYVNRAISEIAISENEYQTFELKTTGGNKSYMFVSLSPEQVIIPESLKEFVDELPDPMEVNRLTDRIVKNKGSIRMRIYWE